MYSREPDAHTHCAKLKINYSVDISAVVWYRLRAHRVLFEFVMSGLPVSGLSAVASGRAASTHSKASHIWTRVVLLALACLAANICLKRLSWSVITVASVSPCLIVHSVTFGCMAHRMQGRVSRDYKSASRHLPRLPDSTLSFVFSCHLRH